MILYVSLKRASHSASSSTQKNLKAEILSLATLALLQAFLGLGIELSAKIRPRMSIVLIERSRPKTSYRYFSAYLYLCYKISSLFF